LCLKEFVVCASTQSTTSLKTQDLSTQSKTSLQNTRTLYTIHNISYGTRTLHTIHNIPSKHKSSLHNPQHLLTHKDSPEFLYLKEFVVCVESPCVLKNLWFVLRVLVSYRICGLCGELLCLKGCCGLCGYKKSPHKPHIL
jgi:hypothetical protein